MKRLFKFLPLLLFVAALGVGCQKADTPFENKQLERSSFVQGKSKYEQKEHYQKLNFEAKKGLWSNKITQLIGQDLPLEHAGLIQQLRERIVRSVSEAELSSDMELQRIAIELAQLTPESDFISMFNQLEDYRFSGNFEYSGEGSNIVNNLRADFSAKISTNNPRLPDLPACNCNWTCGSYGEDCTHDNCEETSSGCGFLWLFSCRHRDEVLCP
jgi:hypothetical protein